MMQTQIMLKSLNNWLVFLLAIFVTPLFALAANDVSVSDNTNFELNTSDTAVLTTLVASAGGQATNFDVQLNYIDITLDNLSSVIFTTTVSGQYLKVTKQSGSDDYTLNPTCPTNTVTMTGTGATVILRLEVMTTNSCTTPPPPSGGGGGGGGTSSITPINGVCGLADHGSYSYSAPTTNLCSAGTASLVAGSGPWTWICNGLYDGSDSSLCITNKAISPTVPVTPVTQVCPVYLTEEIKLGENNDINQVKKLQSFLVQYEGFTNIAITGIYDQITFEAVKVFQTRYAQDILIPWGFTNPTGYVYTTTIKKINEIYCQKRNLPAVTPSEPQMSTCQFIELLINIDVIAPDKANLARSALQCPFSVIPIVPITPIVPVTPSQPQMSTCQFIELLINIDVIAPDKANLARSALKCPLSTISTVCPVYLTEYIKLGENNDINQVKKLQSFLVQYEGFTNLAITGIYDQITFEAVKVFQSRYAQDILTPWGFTNPTGYVYTTTIKKINELYCRSFNSL